ncbi:MAG TPA: ABC transporter substrate-binding protein [Nocardioidaceae bacterium]|nr:ABC transporter substrate-binding protein [Nocardioidaceae bacterium]
MRKISLVAGAVVAGLVLASCGSDDGGGGTGGGSASDEVEVFTWWTEGGEKAGLDGLVKTFEQQSDFTFVNGAVAGGAGSNAKAVLASRLQSQDPPDTFQAHAGAELADYIEAGQIQDVSSLYDEEGWTDVFPQGVLDAITVDDKIYSVPVNIHRANVVWANPTVLKDAGITAVPDSIEAWIDDMEKLKSSGIDAPLAVATDWTQVHLFETVLISDLGPEAYSGLWTGDTDWGSSEVTQALEDYKTLLSYANTDRSGLDWPDAAKYVTDGKAAYTVMGDWTAGAFKDQGLVDGKDYTWFPVPGQDGVFDFLADSFTLPVGAPNEEGAKAWLGTVGSAEGQEAFNTAKGSIPVRTDADPNAYDEYQQEAIKAFANDEIVPSLAHGAAAPVAWLTEITSSVGQFGQTGDVAGFQDALVSAAETHAG